MRSFFFFALIGPARLQRIAGLSFLMICLATFWVMGFPWYVDALFASVATWLAVQGKRIELALTGFSLLAALTVAAAVFQLSIHKEETKTYFRPDDMFWGGPRPNSFKADVDVLFPMPHGDLGLSNALPRTMRQPRTVRFKTDNLGWRNDAPYSGQNVVVCGDSFVVGTGNSQEDTLANILTRQFALPTYSVAYPVTPQGYFDMCLDFLKTTKATPDIHMFVFEGNDFAFDDCPSIPNVVSPSLYSSYKFSVAYQLGKKFALFPFLANFWAQMDSRVFNRHAAALGLGKARGEYLAFLTPYVQATLCPTPRLVLDNPQQEVLQRLKAVYFVPTKYRTYQPLLDEALTNPIPEPAPGLTALHRFFDEKGIAVVDLTPALRTAANTNLEHGKLIYWRDDTHWNKEALQVAAKAVLEMQGR